MQNPFLGMLLLFDNSVSLPVQRSVLVQYLNSKIHIEI